MKLSIKTVVLQDMMSRAVKGASQNKLIPLTSLMLVAVKDKQLTLITTDMSNTLYVMSELDNEDFYCVIQIDQFAKLIGKMTSENITLEVDNNVLTVKGNGTYKLELPFDENGDVINYPNPASEIQMNGKLEEITLSNIKTILTANKPCLAVTMEDPQYTGYYVGDRVITSDTYVICEYKAKILKNAVLIPAETMELLNVMTEDKIDIYIQDDIIEFITKDCIVYGHLMDGIESYAIEPISNLLDESFKSVCKLSKADLLSLLDRISLFVGAYDKQAIMLTFTDKGLDISSKQSNGVETIPYIESKGFKPYTCKLDITALSKQIKANGSDTIELHYGNNNSVKIVDDSITQVIALLDEG